MESEFNGVDESTAGRAFQDVPDLDPAKAFDPHVQLHGEAAA
jgi:hypothetical protein